jgi:hypothetical protein
MLFRSHAVEEIEDETAKKLCLWALEFIDVSFLFIYSMAVSYASVLIPQAASPDFLPALAIGYKQAGVNPSVRVHGG